MNGTVTDPATAASQGQEAGREFARDLLASHRAQSPLDTIAMMQGAVHSLSEGLRRAVEQARASGSSWADVGRMLGTTRQAAFQRFGRPTDPRTGRPMTENLLPDAADRAVGLFSDLVAGRWERARRDFGERVASRLDAPRLAAVWAALSGRAGAYERMGTPLVYPGGDLTIVDVPLFFEADERIGRVSYDQRGKVAGLFFLPPALA
ncbi:DUF3887 domain-containing protein [Rugosimonospora africana]|uniref:DUF3887 domain-containing protein n=1 Tax=Rugosimonospora africana TaxID=556532 RepID=UPI001940EC29|nr:DUF3887 domain-containing protein [Rugosimonospora africana]